MCLQGKWQWTTLPKCTYWSTLLLNFRGGQLRRVLQGRIRQVRVSQLKDVTILLSESTLLNLFPFCRYTTLYHRHETKQHGCIIGYQDTVWKQVEYRTLDYDTDKSCKPTQTTGNIGQLLALTFRQEEHGGDGKTGGLGGGGGGIIVGNTHLYWHPKSTYERCRQALIYRYHLFAFQKQLADKDPDAHWLPLMLGGK